MSEALARALLLERIHAWRFADIERIEQGQSENVYRLTLGGRRALFKFDVGRRARFVNRRRDEADIQRRAAAAGLSPTVYYVDDECLLTGYVDARALTATDLRRSDVMQRLGRRLREVHALPRTGRRFQARLAAEDYASRIAGCTIRDRCLAFVQALPVTGRTAVFSHNDLVAGNVLGTDELLFIDWEYACDNSPLFDLATVVAHHHLDRDAVLPLLEGYFGRCETASLDELALYERAYHALHWLWLAARDRSNARLDDIAAALMD